MTGGSWQSLLQQASALRRAGRVAEAIAAYRHVLAVRPDLPDSWYNLGWLQRQAGEFEEALSSYGEALKRGVEGPEEVHLNRAVLLSDHLGRIEEAQAELDSALSIQPDYVPALLNLGNLHEDLGRKSEARSAYQRARAADPANMLALTRLAGVTQPAAADDPLIDAVRKALQRSDITVADRADLGFALGRLLDSVGAYDEAFEAYRAANAASRASFGPGFRGYERTAHEALVDRLIRAFPGPAAKAPPPQGATPLFICGMYRSGSTLTEQILAAHPAVRAGGELDLIPNLAARELQPYPESAAGLGPEAVEQLRRAYFAGLQRRGLGTGLVTDKRPDNFLHIGLIKTLFPDAKIVHTRRNPLDNCLSVYFLHLDPGMAYALDLEDSAHWYRHYRRLMAHWKSLYPGDIFDLDYEQLVADPRATMESLLQFCGLPWDEACLEFHSAPTAVRTASVWQVRQPLYSASAGRWRNYARHLEPLRAALDGLE